jgi:hypothetical protein
VFCIASARGISLLSVAGNASVIIISPMTVSAMDVSVISGLARMIFYRSRLETEFLKLCRARGPHWIESVIRPLRLHGDHVTVRDIPTRALIAAVRMFA